ncbi:MAG: hypothetical protein A2Y72_03285 [Chloroflexi bacterium RBG_13_53_26]|nr:MAG: hypothetical protein A2Y72_03285 [Chloroflexi bacterium RBG_13_53_26]
MIVIPMTEAYDCRVMSEGTEVVKLKPGYHSVQAYDGIVYFGVGDHVPVLDSEGVPSPDWVILQTGEKEILKIETASDWTFHIETGAKAQLIFRGYL